LSLGLPPHPDFSDGSIDILSEIVEERKWHNGDDIFMEGAFQQVVSMKMEQRLHACGLNEDCEAGASSRGAVLVGMRS
jgi:hypothetical protein